MASPSQKHKREHTKLPPPREHFETISETPERRTSRAKMEDGRWPKGHVPYGAATQWKKGQSGNPGGRPKGKASVRSALSRVLTRKDAEAIAKDIINQARKGSLKHQAMVMEQMDGKLPETVHHLVTEQRTIILGGATAQDAIKVIEHTEEPKQLEG